MADDAMQVEQNGKLQINWGIFNIPTIIAIAGVLWVTSAQQERQDARLDQFDAYVQSNERERASRSAELNRLLEALTVKIAPLENVIYRVTVSEQGVADVNRRIDRFGDAIQSIRDDFGTLNTKIDVLTEQVRAAIPDKRVDLGNPPRELSHR